MNPDWPLKHSNFISHQPKKTMLPGLEVRSASTTLHMKLKLAFFFVNCMCYMQFRIRHQLDDEMVSLITGAIFGGTDMISTRSLTKEAYVKHNKVPDWADLLYNCWEEKMSL